MSQHLEHLLIPLSDSIRRLVENRWRSQEYGDAVLAALRHLESAVRHRTGAPADLVGQELMRHAFNQRDGGGIRLAGIEAEQHGAYFLYAGVMAFVRNPMAHREVRIDAEDAAQLIGFIDLLIKWFDGGLERAAAPNVQSEDYDAIRLLADVDGDGERELVLIDLPQPGIPTAGPEQVVQHDSCTSGTIIAIVKRGRVVARHFLRDATSDRGVWIWSRDLDGDGKSEVIVRAVFGVHSFLHWILRFQAGQLVPLIDGVLSDGGFRIEDLDQDGREEVIFGNRLYRLGDPGIESIIDDTRYAVFVWKEGTLVPRGDGPQHSGALWPGERW